MSKLILIRAGQTDWQAQGRLVGDTDLRLNEVGHQQAAEDAAAMVSFAPHIVHCGGDEPSRQTAAIIGNELKVKVKPSDGLREMDLGHWEGLTVDAFKERFGKVFKQWRNDPLSVEPPEGESIAQMLARVKKALGKVVKKNGNKKAMAIVLGGYAYAAVLCDLRDGDFEQFWRYVETDIGSAPPATLMIENLVLEVSGAIS